MRYVSVIKTVALIGLISSVSLFATSRFASAEIDIDSLGGQATMAEQGAICASFAALMENQILINVDLGQLWSERRKFSGAVIRRAVELSGQPSPASEELDHLINEYREWLLLNLSSRDTATSISDYQTDVQNLIRTNCATLFIQADKAILNRFPSLRYLVDGAQPAPTNTDENDKQIQNLLRKNTELNTKVIALNAEISALKLAAKNQSLPKPETKLADVATTPTKRPAPPPKPVALNPVALNKDQTSEKGQKDKKQANQAQPQAATGRFFAQLGSYSTQAFAEKALNELMTSQKTLFEALTLSIQPHAFASGKTFYRIKTSGASRQQITTICDHLWDARMGCLIKTNID